MNPMMRNLGRAALLGLAVAALAACAGGTRQPPKPAVERAAERWQHLLAAEYETAWEYLSPGYRAKIPANRYAAQTAARPVKWTSAEVQGEECDASGEACDVRVKLGFRVRSRLPGVGWVDATDIVVERWLLLDGAWYNLPDAGR